ncbi:penicillin acylase family protein [Roseomonas nepalensis]|uniref:Penicillin acylase family protein n=1 Tax=Muricoccus nepalensis TaxID=1854500 RepID=A0A502GFJ3_9PROT|nr:penicillin acylase family protein [Roseomonas nepalensis]TPG59826.1 penicillin acylase family protein [Roseomonas nepalensis]
MALTTRPSRIPRGAQDGQSRIPEGGAPPPGRPGRVRGRLARWRRRPRSPWRWLWRGLALLVALPVLAAAGIAALLWATLPAEVEALRLPGLSAPVEIDFDPRGVPRIRARTERDAAMALGVLHARDRLFQMEMTRRNGAGRLSEIAGPATLRLDRTMRTLGLQERARADLVALPPEARDMLEAYADGVNAWIKTHGRFAAPEFIPLGQPEPWRAADSLLWGKIMGVWLSGNWRTEVERARLAAVLPPERLAELWPSDDSPGRPDLAFLPPPERLAGLLDATPRWGEDAPLPPSASNAWAVAPARSATGGALLASDPHLALGAPALWYLARIELPGGRFLAGATAPGVPMMVIGRNERLAWGFTTTHSDTQDVFVERLAGDDAYETPEGRRPFAVREERIGVRGGPDVVIRVRETRHGPVLSDLDERPPEGQVLAVSMASLAPADTQAAGLLALNRAGSVPEARAAAALIASPAQNLMVADTAGGIAMFLTGRTPVRAAGDGSLPAPGWDGSHDWRGWVPFDAMPHAEAPASGVLANANNRVQPAGHEPFLGRDWFGDWRFRRIGEMLRERPRHAPADFAAMQADAISLHAREMLPLLLAPPRPEGVAGAARDLMGRWDGAMLPGLPQPLVFNAWARELGRLALAEGGVPEGAFVVGPEFLRLLLSPAGAAWCGAGGCEALSARALEAAVAALEPRFGPDPSAWRWGAVHRVRLEHPLLRFVPVLADWLRIEAPTPGDNETVNRGGMARDFSHVHGPGLRIVMDLSTPEGVLAAIATGQSGNPFSRHWGDMNEGWVAGRVEPFGAKARVTARLGLRP